MRHLLLRAFSFSQPKLIDAWRKDNKHLLSTCHKLSNLEIVELSNLVAGIPRIQLKQLATKDYMQHFFREITRRVYALDIENVLKVSRRWVKNTTLSGPEFTDQF